MRRTPASSVRRFSSVLLALACLLVSGRQARAQGIVVNGPFYGSGGSAGGDMLDVRADATGARLAFRAQTLDTERGTLFSIRSTNRGPLVQLSGTGDVDDEYVLSPDGSRVLYSSDEIVDDVFELYSAPSDGSGAPVLLSTGPASGVRVSPDGAWALFLAPDPAGSHLFSAPIDGSSPTVRLDAGSSGVAAFAVSPDSTRVVYLADEVPGQYEVFVTPIDGSSAGLRLCPALGATSDATHVVISPSGDRVAYRADQDSDEVYELYSAPIDASAPAVKLNPAFSGAQDVEQIAFTPAGQVLYLADLVTNGFYSLHRVPADGSAPPTEVSPPMVAGGGIVNLTVHASGPNAVYRADQEVDGVFELFTFPADGPGAPTKISGTIAASEDVFSYVIGPDGTRVAYIVADQFVEPHADLYVTDMDGSGTAVRISPTCGCSSTPVDVHFSPEGDRIGFRGLYGGTTDLYSVPADASQPAEKVNPALPSDRDVLYGRLIGDERAVYIANQRMVTVQELFVTTTDGLTSPKRVAAPLYPASGQVIEPVLSPSGREVLYSSRQETDKFEVYRARLDGTQNSTKVTAPLPSFANSQVAYYAFTWDESRILYRADAEVASQYYLYSVPADGSAGPVRLNGSETVTLYQIGDTRVLYIGLNNTRLSSAPLDGSQPAIQLSGTLQPSSVIDNWLLHRGTGRVAYQAKELSTLFELYSVPIDASSPKVRIHTPVASAEIEDDFAFVPDGSRLVYRATSAGTTHLFAAPSDGSSSPTQLSAPLVAGGNVFDFWIAPDGERVVYRADQELDGQLQLYVVPIDASAAPLRLHPSLAADRDVQNAAISPDGAWVAYRVDTLSDEVYELFSVPITGGASNRLSHTLIPLGDVQDEFQISGTNVVVFLADLAVDNCLELFAAPLDGSAPEVRLHPPLGTRVRDVQPDFAIAADASRVLFRAPLGASTTFYELWSAPLDGSRPPHLESRADPLHGVDSFLLTPQGDKTVFRGSQRLQGLQELYLTFLGPGTPGGTKGRTPR